MSNSSLSVVKKTSAIKPLKVLKIVGVLLSVGGMVVTSYVTDKENKNTLKELFEKGQKDINNIG